MVAQPSIKGSVFSAAVEDVNKLIAGGTLDRDAARRWLTDDDLERLDETINVAAWYDVRSYDRFNLLLRDLEGDGKSEYLREKGRGTARRLIEMGVYSQMEYLQRTQVARTEGREERFAAFGRDLKRLNTLSASILNFTRWEVLPDPDCAMRYVMQVSEAEQMPESLVWRTDGFVNEMASRHLAADLWSWRRPRPDLIVFRMVREI